MNANLNQEFYESIRLNDIGRLYNLWETNIHNIDLTKPIFSIPKNNINCSLFLSIPSESLTLLHLAAFTNSLDSFIFLHKKGIDIKSQSGDSYLPIFYACYVGSSKIVEYILSIDPQQINDNPDHIQKLVKYSIFSESPSIIRLLAENGVDLSYMPEKDWTYLDWAIQKDNVEIIKILIENGAKYRMNDEKFSVTMLAIAFNSMNAAIYFIEHDENLAYFSPSNYQTALSVACFQKYENLVKLICEKLSNVDIDPSIHQKAAVHWICESGNVEIAKAVLAKGIDVTRLDNNGKPGLFYLCNIADDEVLIHFFELLCEYGYDINIEYIDLAHIGFETILLSFIKSIYRPLKAIEWLLYHGALVDENTLNFAKRNRNLKALIQKYINQ